MFFLYTIQDVNETLLYNTITIRERDTIFD